MKHELPGIRLQRESYFLVLFILAELLIFEMISIGSSPYNMS